MKFYVFTTPTGDVQVMNCTSYLLAVANHKDRADNGSETAWTWLEVLAKASLIEARDATHAKEIYRTGRST